MLVIIIIRVAQNGLPAACRLLPSAHNCSASPHCTHEDMKVQKGYTARKGWSWDLHPSLFGCGARVLLTLCCPRSLSLSLSVPLSLCLSPLLPSALPTPAGL